MAADLDAYLDAIFAAPLSEFTQRRNDLADRLREEGRADAARSVRELRKPPLSAWAVNALWHHEREAFEALLAATESVREATRGGSFGDDHREAMATRRKAIDDLLRRAEQHLSAHDHAATKATMRKIHTTLDTIAGHGRQIMTPAPGRLESDLAPAGFGALAAFGLPDAPEKPSVDEDALARLRKKLDAATRKAEQTEATVQAADRRAREAKEVAERARAEHAAAKEELETLRERLAALEGGTREDSS